MVKLKILFCPFYPKYERYYKKSLDRKPNPGMILKLKKYNLDHKNCFMIGDNLIDQLWQKIKVNFF